jgi:hypothetical protein
MTSSSTSTGAHEFLNAPLMFSDARPAPEPGPGVWSNVAVTLVTPIVMALFIGLLSDDHREPCLLAITLGFVPWALIRQCPRVTVSTARFAFEAASYVASGAWLAIALWAMLDHHR